MRRSHARSIAIAALSVALPACDGCHGGKPYTPYTLTDTPPSSSVASPPAPVVDAGPFTAVTAGPAPDGGARWPLEGGAVEAPPGHAFAEGLVIDADADGKQDLIAWSRAPDGLRGELWFASGKAPGEGRMIAAIPADLAAAGCSASATLSLVGPRTAAFDFVPRCPARIAERAVRWIAAVRFVDGPPEIALELRAHAPADGEALQIALDGRDRDGDGRGDVAISFTLTGAPKPLHPGGSAAATLAFFDRPAGLSRDPTEPEASFKAIGAALVADGRRKTTSPRVPGAAITARRLHAMICEDVGGKPLVTTTAGPLRCGDVRLAEESAIAEVEAALNLGDPVAAFAALGRLDALGVRRRDVDSLVAKSVHTVGGTLVRVTAAIPDIVEPPAFAPVAFEKNGDLLVRTRDGVVRVDKASFAESAVDPAPAWPKRLAWPNGDAPSWGLDRIEDTCDAPMLHARFLVGGEASTLPIPVASPGRCTPASRVEADFLGNSAQGILFAVRGEIVAVPAQTSPRPTLAESLAGEAALGAARSPDGGTVAITTSRGVLVAVLKGSGRGASAKLWTAPLVDGATSCVPSDGGERLACAVSKGAVIYELR